MDCTWLANQQDTFHGHGKRMYCVLYVLQCIGRTVHYLPEEVLYRETTNYGNAMLHLQKNIFGINIMGSADERKLV